ncbi:hypothetical protein [Solicola gregarius]|uniref:Uncharacterized protein n=1 Tax=Solicola gregarius TaxID=2908642 RepID=A0AA46YMU0_9ACTN|nr:hypothetical protein [Solicola gregarius]UYM06821.1 hypothetical protein L0C25_07025 [Solicola gregarius]
MNVHETHTWQPRSQHSTSEGLIVYEQCTCGRWRVTLAEGEHELVRTSPVARAA